MTTPTEDVNYVYREDETFGVPASGDHEPIKAEIRALLHRIIIAIQAGEFDEPPGWEAMLAEILAKIEDLDAYVDTGIQAKIDEDVQPLVDAAAASAADAAASAAEVAGLSTELVTDPNSTLAFAVIDTAGYIAFGVTQDGEIIGLLTAGGSSASSYPAPTEDALPVGTIHGVMLYGQSLSNGYGNGGIPIYSASQPFDNLMFPGGVADASAYTSFVPLVALTVGNHGETIANGLADSVSDRLQPNRYSLLVNSEGIDATAVAGLVKGQSPFTNLISAVTAAKAEADSVNEAFYCQSLHFIQGESDEQADTPKATYKAALLGLFADFITDAKAAAGQSHDPICFFDQVASHTGYLNTTPTVAIAQYELHRDNPQHILVGPKYQYDYVDTAHLSADSYRWNGEQHGKVYFQTVVLGLPWRPLMPLVVKKHGARVIMAKFHVPKGPLVLDDDTISDPNGAYGFEVADSSGAVAIDSVELIGADSVKITCGANLAASPLLRYAFTGVSGEAPGPNSGARGCLRDSDATQSYYRNASNQRYPLQNWCVTFEEPVT